MANKKTARKSRGGEHPYVGRITPAVCEALADTFKEIQAQIDAKWESLPPDQESGDRPPDLMAMLAEPFTFTRDEYQRYVEKPDGFGQLLDDLALKYKGVT